MEVAQCQQAGNERAQLRRLRCAVCLMFAGVWLIFISPSVIELAATGYIPLA